MGKTVASRDSFVVNSEPLSGILVGFVSQWERDRPKARGHTHGRPADEIVNVRATEWLSATSGIPEWKIKEVMRQKTPTTTLRIADALIAAVGCPEVFYDGTLTVLDEIAAEVRQLTSSSEQTEVSASSVAAAPARAPA